MVNNRVIRRQGYSTANGYGRLVEDFTELFSGFQGVSIEKSTLNDDGTGTEQTKIFLDKNKKLYLLIVPDSAYAVRISIHCGEGTKETENWVYVDARSKNEKFTYSFAKTAYGAAFSTLPYISDNKASLSDGYLQNFFTTFETQDGRTVNGFIFCAHIKDEQSNMSTSSYIVTEDHDALEVVDFSKCFLGSAANQTVLVNATSYTKPVVSNHLYKKIQSEEGKFGRMKLSGRLFISGSHFCLEGEEED